MNLRDYTYPSRRTVTVGAHGMVATGQHLASQAGLEILRQGGNAIDAAVATAIALTVVEPTCNGVGGDAFAILWTKNGIDGLNASGPSGSKADAQKLKDMGYSKMPDFGIYSVNVPGAPSAWIALSRKYGKLPFGKLFEPAIRYAREGFAVSPVIADLWEAEFQKHTRLHGKLPLHKAWFDTFAKEGRAPRAGEVFRNPELANTLQELADTNCESFYRGPLADKIIALSDEADGFLTKEDLAKYQPEWVKPLSVSYRGYDVWEIPPNGHGMVVLMALNILNGLSVGEGLEEREKTEHYHRSIEALKLAYADGKKYITDLRHMKVTPEQLLNPAYAAKRRELIGEEAILPTCGKPDSCGTVYLCAADEEGNMISYIQSNYQKFGSGLVVPGTSIALHNRGREFSLNPADDNYLLPGKKTYHTIIPGFLSKDGKPVGPFGVMGAYMQPQGQLQVVQNLIDYHMNPQQALNTPRWQWVGEKEILVEHGFTEEIRKELENRGHQIHYSEDTGSFGRGQIILRTDEGTYMGGTEPRTDGAILAF